ncbi:MAG: glycoside hydrolase family 31 protein [Chthoniobacteraceae bacterium]
MPFTSGAAYELRGDNWGNQAAPFLVSSAGRYVWSEEPFRFSFENQFLSLEGDGPFVIESRNKTMKEGILDAAKQFFPPRNKIPSSLFFTQPQYNTWIELMYDQNQEDVLRYARDLLREGYPPGILMIDEGWQRYYGDWEFDPIRFPKPKELVQQLHKLGFKVMLWVVPFIVPDSRVFRELRGGGVLVKEPNGKPAIREWWNGYSAVVDLTGSEGAEWFEKQLDRLQHNYGIDGFKFDGGDTPTYRAQDAVALPTHPNGQTEAFGRFGIKYPYNEYRACWKCGGEPLVQRLRDRTHTWDQQGLNCIVPNMISQGMLGYPFGCPDMIGGGDYESFLQRNHRLDPELFVRSAQACALMPMMQFSAATWRVLDRRHHRICVEAAKLHSKFGKKILQLAKAAAQTGEPIVRHLAYEYPAGGYEKVNDQFLIGSHLMVAPVLEKGAKTRNVVIPPGNWVADDGAKFTGPATVEIQTPLERLPYFIKRGPKQTKS